MNNKRRVRIRLTRYIGMLPIIIPAILSAQQVDIDIPSCNYLQYVFYLKQGAKQDTVAIGRFDDNGKASFTISNKYASYRGVGNLSVPTTTKQINIIINNEPLITINEVSDAEDKLSASSTENTYLAAQLTRGGNILKGYNDVLNEQQNSLLALPAQQILNLDTQYSLYIKDIQTSPLYAARILELLNFISGMGSKPRASDEDIRKEQQRFVTDNVDFKDLYTSGFWELSLNLWYEINTYGVDQSSDSLLLHSARTMLDKVQDIPIRRELTQEIIRLFSRYGRDNLLAELGSKYLTIPINGKPAPELVTDSVPILPKSCLIIFYDSNCGSCHNELYQLREKYSLLNNKHNQIDVISVAADTNIDLYEETASKLPWTKLCDYKGFNGKNFINYGIVSTPTLILVDKEGIVRGRYARLSEFLKN